MKPCFNTTFFILDSLRVCQGSQCLGCSFASGENYMQEIRETHEKSTFSYHFSSSSRIRIKIWISLFSAPLELTSKFFYLKLEISSPLYLLFLNTDLFFRNDFELSEKCVVALASVVASGHQRMFHLSKFSTCQCW